jgi:tetratricopeptide (TPR) repeat protein
MAFRFPQPSNEDDFELFCLRLLRELWRCPTLQQYGKRGERQHGIDLIDEAASTPFRAVQCKHHESDKTIPPAEIEAEVTKALGSGQPLDEYYILTTGRKSTQGQNAIIRINRDHATNGRFKVFVWTWADIETRLSEMDDMALERVLRGDTGRSGPAIGRMMSEILTGHFDRPLYASGTALDTELEGIERIIERHDLELAEAKLKELEIRAADKFQPHHSYQVRALRARILSNRWQWGQAGRELLDAKRFMPQTERARINEALGYELMGDRTTAYALANSLRQELPHVVRLVTIWVRTAPEDTPFESLVEVAAPLAKDDEELNLALAHRALLANRILDALSFARRASDLDSNSPPAWFILGQVKHKEAFAGAAGIQSAHLREAAEHYDRAVRLAHEQKMPGLEAAARFNRGKARHLLGDAGAEADYAVAIELARPDQGLRTSYAGYLIEMGRPSDALRELAPENGEPTSVRLFYEAAARYERNTGDDRQQAVALLRRVIASEVSDRWDDAHILLVQWAIESKNTGDVRTEIRGSRLRETNPLVFHTLTGWLSSADGDQGSATSAFEAASQVVTDGSSRDHLYLLAQALVSVGADERALSLLLRCYRPGRFDVECRKLLDCAHRLDRHDVSYRVCRELREAGVTDPRIIRTELQVLQMYDPQEALRVAQDYLASHPTDHHVALWQSTLALRLDRPDVVISDLARLPAPADITPEGCGLMINILRETGRPGEAIKYAYDALRAHFDEEFAHGQFIAHFLYLSPRLREFHVGGTAGPGMAVCYREEREEVDRWVVIEDAAEPILTLDELGRDHPISQALAGHQAGDTFTLSGTGIQPRSATIRDVVHKYVYRFRDCINRYQVRFPGGSACQLVHVGSGDMFDPTPVIRGLQDRRRQIELLDEVYRTQAVPFHAYGRLAGSTEPEVWVHLAFTADLGIRCFNGRRDELAAGLELARRCKIVVVDLTAILTLGRLGLLRVLQSDTRSVLVAQTTFDRLQHLAEEAAHEGREGGSLLLDDHGQLAWIEITPEQRERRRAFLASMRDAVRDHCVIRPSLKTAELEPRQREQLIQTLGRHNLDSMLLATESDAVLWTDDLILAIVGRADFQCQRVWTQAVLIVLQQEGTISQQDYDRAIAELVGAQYHGVLWNANTLLAAAEIAEWRMDRWPVPQAMRGLGDKEANPLERIRIAAEAVRAVWRLDFDPLRKQSFLFAVLAGIGSISLVRRLQQAVPPIFSVDVFSADEVVDCISAWLRCSTRRLLEL